MKAISFFFKTALFFVWLILFCKKLNAQTYYINNGFVNAQTITTCSGTFYDSDPNGNYGTREDYIVTFKPGTPSNIIQFNFSELYLNSGDTLFIYDGVSTQNNVLDTFTNVNYNYAQSISPTDTSNSGSLTFHFKSDNSLQSAGWKALISCAYPCKQRILANIITTPSKDASGYTNFCLNDGGVISFNAITNFPDNGLVYNQSNTTSKFHWFFGDGKDTVATNLTTINHIFQQQGGYFVKLIITDSNGCVNRLSINTKLRTGIKPNFSISAPNTMCVGDTAFLYPNAISSPSGGGFVGPQQGIFVTLPVSSDSLFLPDGSGVTYASNIFINQFAAGQTLNDINDLLGVIVNMEHSYLGDLQISIVAPNGTTVVLKKYPGASNCYLGEPVDEDSPPAPLSVQAQLERVVGKGYSYTFNNNPQYGTMVSESSSHTYTFIDNAGRTQTNKIYLPAGSYRSESALSALVGTPLNGTWTLKIKDNLSIDNGYLFSWKLDFNPSIFPNVETYNVPIVSQNWVTPTPGIQSVNGNVATVIPTVARDYSFIYRVVDGYGCTFDSTVIVKANPLPTKPYLGNDIALCDGITTTNLTVNNPDATAYYTWDNGATGVAINVNTLGTYIVTANNAYSCKTFDTIKVIIPQPITVNLGIDTMFCASNPNLLKPIVSNNVTNYVWNDGSTKDTLRINAIGEYYVTVTSDENCKVADTINITNNPINDFKMPVDTIACEKSSFLLSLNLPVNSNILWNDGFTGTARIVSPFNIYTTIANHQGCLKENKYTVNSKPLPVINLGTDLTLCNSQQITLSASYPGATYLWNTGNTDSFYTIKAENIYWLETTFNECKFRDSISVIYKSCDCNTVIPNAFSPNGDGVNDVLKPLMKCTPVKYLFSIFNRYGQKVFETTDYQKGWDGRFSNHNLPVGTYYYILTYKNPGLQINEKFSGSITILR